MHDRWCSSNAWAKIRISSICSLNDVATNSTFVHCFIHSFALCTGVLPSGLMSCLNKIIKIVKFIKTSALNSRLFARLCQDVGSDHKCLLFHTEVRWLSRRNMTRRVFELKRELLIFFEEKNHEFKDDLENDEFISRLAFFVGYFPDFQPHKSFVPRIKQQYYSFYFKAGSIHSQTRCLD